MKLISEGSFGDSDEKCNESVLYVLGLDSMDTMDFSFKEIEKA
jgi:acyl carrier protein